MQSTFERRIAETVSATNQSKSIDVSGVSASTAQRLARTTCTVLLSGETGVGKGHVARWLHDNGPRRDQPMIPVNCGAIPEHLIDSQLFGHVRGAFTGADREQPGLVRAAEGGTLLLDEVSELPMTAQVRLLRLLEDREVLPVGRSRPESVDVRIIAATNRNLRRLVESGEFREDLYYRLNVIEVTIGPLRDRCDDIEPLFDVFNHEFADVYDQPPVSLTDDAQRMLRWYDWPGNVRELRIVAERLHVLCPDAVVTPEHLARCGQLPALRDRNQRPASMIEPKLIEPLSERMQEARHSAVRKALAECGGNVTSAARSIGVHRSTLYRWLAECD